MKLPDLDPTGGPLSVSEVLIEYDGPQLFVAKNYGGALFLALHGPPASGADQWIFARTTRYRINQLVSGQITLRSAMTEYARGDLAIASSSDGEWQHEYIPVEDASPTYLPAENSYIQHTNPLEISRAVTAALRQPDEDFGLPIPVYADMWEFDPQTIRYLKENTTPLYVVAQRRQRLVADIILSDGDARHDIPLPDLSRILISLQKTVDSLGAAVDQEDWKPTQLSKTQTRLDAIATFPSSFGLRIEAHQGALADEGAGALAFQRLIELLSSISDLETLKSSFLQHSQATKLQFGKFVEYVAKSGNSVRISASTGMSSRTETAHVSNETLSDVSARIREINETSFDDVRFEGRLKAISLKTKFFLIENEDSSYSGRIEDQLLPKISGMAIDESYLADIRISYAIHELTGEIGSKAVLVNLEPL